MIIPLQEKSRRPPPPYRRAWLLNPSGIHKIAAGTGQTLLTIRNSADVRTIAIDDGGGIVWAVGPNRLLRGFWFDGKLAHRARLPRGLEATGASVQIDIDQADGGVWIGIHKTLLHYDGLGALQSTKTFPQALQSLSADFERSRLWVATSKTLVAIDCRTEKELVIIPLKTSSRPVALSVEPSSGKLWAIVGASVRAYDSSGKMLTQANIRNRGLIVASPSDGAWIAIERGVVRVGPSGKRLFTVNPFKPSRKLVALALDRKSGSLWACSTRSVAVVGETKGSNEVPISSKEPHRHLRLSYSRSSPPDFGETRGPGVILSFDVTSKLWQVADLWRGSAGEKAGIRVGDAMLAFNGVTIPIVPPSVRMPDVVRELRAAYARAGAARVDNRDTFQIKRGSETLNITTTAALLRDQARYGIVRAVLGVDDPAPSFCYNCAPGCPTTMQGHMWCFEPHDEPGPPEVEGPNDDTPSPGGQPSCSGSCNAPSV
jgi:hypothetical protein